jgi:hypothetical protein
MINAYLTYDDLVEATTLMADRLLVAQDQVLDLNERLATAHGEVAALRGALEFEQDRARALRNRGDHWQIVAAERPPRLGHLPRAAAFDLFGKLRRAIA